MRRLGILVIAVAGVFAGTGHAPAALAQTPPSSLNGEVLGSSGLLSGCNLSAPAGTYTYSTRGTAVGPYPGTYTETGSFTTNGTGSVTAFSATFTIRSATGTVTGSKRFNPFDSGSYAAVMCPGGRVGFGGLATYTATIDCAYQDTGNAIVEVLGTPSTSSSRSLTNVTSFELFFSNGMVPISQDNQGNDNCQGDENT